MRSTHRVASTVVLACLLLASCKSGSLGTSTSSESRSPVAGASGTSASAGARRAIAVGAGPQKHYTVQQQPAAATTGPSTASRWRTRSARRARSPRR